MPHRIRACRPPRTQLCLPPDRQPLASQRASSTPIDEVSRYRRRLVPAIATPPSTHSAPTAQHRQQRQQGRQARETRSSARRSTRGSQILPAGKRLQALPARLPATRVQSPNRPAGRRQAPRPPHPHATATANAVPDRERIRSSRGLPSNALEWYRLMGLQSRRDGQGRRQGVWNQWRSCMSPAQAGVQPWGNDRGRCLNCRRQSRRNSLGAPAPRHPVVAWHGSH